MARHGRGFPLGTSYQTLQRTVPSNPLSGAASFTLTGSGSLTLLSSVIDSTSSAAPHRFRTVVVPPLEDFEAVQRQLQRTQDEVSRAVNPIRSVADGGTGLVEVTAGSIMQGTGSDKMETVPIGPVNYVLTSDGSKATWAPTGGVSAGEANTASNVGVGGVSIVNGKVGVDLQFRSINPASSKITVTLDAANKKLDLDVVVGSTANSVCVGNDSRLSDARTPTGAAGGVLGGTYPNPAFAADMATQAELDAAVAAMNASLTAALTVQSLPSSSADKWGTEGSENWGDERAADRSSQNLVAASNR